MSFLDNLEDNLKAFEGSEGLSSAEQEARRRERERQQALQAAPYVERLKSASYTDPLFTEAARAGHKVRTKVDITWVGTTLRLQARERRLELRPTPEGVVAVFLQDSKELRSVPVDLDRNPAPLIHELLGLTEPKRAGSKPDPAP
ncbi:MAG TPA: hypothetical protein PLA43_16245 [Bryobacteraceae bacterium]|nr:hypothetical protein [Bryobacteraceae bacterium]HOL73356.1 hypothetical protein [Bryobacteraceae bacterium]HOQ47380.1 hypothetical protein [Bryobacteraceae bacterium]HPQ13684.1 hypothetical protein [Bryobacteraceae bacterium]HPU73503.1 hypothetical protein [Bryobacteraceae bacterium]